LFVADIRRTVISANAAAAAAAAVFRAKQSSCGDLGDLFGCCYCCGVHDFCLGGSTRVNNGYE